jgi:hypothetical protein
MVETVSGRNRGRQLTETCGRGLARVLPLFTPGPRRPRNVSRLSGLSTRISRADYRPPRRIGAQMRTGRISASLEEARRLMVQLTFFLDGREICSDDLGPSIHHPGIDRLETIMLLAVSSHVRRRLRAVRCDEHRQAPRVVASGSCPERLTFVVQGCCSRLIDAGTAALEDHEPAALS